MLIPPNVQPSQLYIININKENICGVEASRLGMRCKSAVRAVMYAHNQFPL